MPAPFLRLALFGAALTLVIGCTATSQPSPTAPSAPEASPAADVPDRGTEAVTVYPARAWKVAILTCSPDEVTVANYLRTKSATAYPLVNIQIIPVAGITPDLTNASGVADYQVVLPAIRNAITPKETAMGDTFDMIQLLHQFPHHLTWGISKPGASCSVNTNNYWSMESCLAAGVDTITMTDSPASFAMGVGSAPFTRQWDGGPNYRLMYLVTRLEGHTVTEVKAKIDLACAAPTVPRGGAVIDGPGKGRASNNGAGYTYWQNAWISDGLKNIAADGTTYGYPTKNDMTGYNGDTNGNKMDDKAEMPATAFNYITTNTFPVGYLVSFGLHSNADGSMGPRFTTPTGTYGGLTFAKRSVILGGESFSAYALDSSHPGYGGTNLGQWLALPSAGYIGPKNEPCATGIMSDKFAKYYLGQNLTFAESAYASFNWLKHVYTPFGVGWMTLR